MWARNLELAFGLWLALSPFVFGHPGEAALLWTNDLACAAVIVVLALASYARRWRRVHLGQLVVAAWLIGFGWVSAHETATPASQNHILVGLLLAMFAIVPSRASEPPLPWRDAARAGADSST